MKKLLIAIFGEENAEKPAVKAISYAVLGTAIALILAVIVLVISSIVGATTGTQEPDLPADNGGDKTTDNTDTIKPTVTIEYSTATANDLNAKLGETVSIKNNRTSIDGGVYYAALPNDTLVKSAQSSLDKMLVDFYKANKTKLVIDTSKEECNVPYVHGGDGKYTVLMDTYQEKTTFNVDLYQWIYTNAYKYGFVYNGNTFTYVGVASATYMKNNDNMSYTAFLSKVKTATSNLTVKISTTGYEIYYLSASAELKAPSNYAYTVVAVGNDGYIITVNTSKKVTN